MSREDTWGPGYENSSNQGWDDRTPSAQTNNRDLPFMPRYFPEPTLTEKETCMVWVLWWHYSDGSSQGVERVYLHEARARADFELLELSSGLKTWKLNELVLNEAEE
jgi:hypothetical protein